MIFLKLQKKQIFNSLSAVFLGGLVVTIVGCATPKNYDKFRAANPRSILVLPPKNQSTDIRATYSFLSTVTMPIAEKGFYIYPVAIVDQLMKDNGLPSADEMHEVSLKKIKEILNPDAVLYINLQQYGTKFLLIDSQTTVAASGKLVSTASGDVLWQGTVYKVVSSSQNNGGGIAGMIIGAMVSQAVNSTFDYAHDVSILASQELFMTEGQGLLNGPYKPATTK